MGKYYCEKDRILFSIQVKNQQSFIIIEGQNTINKQIYSLKLYLNELHNKRFFQKCNTIQEAYDLILNNLNNGYIKEINKSNIIFGIHINKNEEILFDLILDPLNNINNNNGNQFQNIFSDDLMNRSNPMCKAMSHILINGGTQITTYNDNNNENNNTNNYFNNGNNYNYNNNNINLQNEINNNMNINNMNNKNMRNMNMNNINNMNSKMDIINMNLINMDNNMSYNRNNYMNMNANINNNVNMNNNKINNMNYSMNNNNIYNNMSNNINNNMNNNNMNMNADINMNNQFNTNNMNMNTNLNKNYNINMNNNMNNNMNYNMTNNMHNMENNNSNIPMNNYMNIPMNNNMNIPMDNNMNNPMNNNMIIGNMNNADYMNIGNINSIFNYENNNALIKIWIMKKQNNNSNEFRNLSGLLKILFIKKLLNNIDINLINSEDIKEILFQIKNNIHFTGDKNIELITKNRVFNIIIYAQYLINLINLNEFYLINNFKNFQLKQELISYCNSLYKYEKYNTFFEINFINYLKNSHFDYSLISINILENDNSEYEQKCGNCPNMKKKIVYFTSNIEPISLKDSDVLKDSTKNYFGRGFYASDKIDDLPSFIINQNNNDFICRKIIPVNAFFSFIAAEIFYDSTKLKIIDIDMDKSNKNISTQNYNDQKLEPNGLFYLNKKSLNNKCLANELVIPEKYQIFPLYTITLKRNEYFVLWRDPNFQNENEYQYKKFLEDIKLFCYKKANINFYYESSTEEALKFLLRRKYGRPIIITSIGRDLSGKRFIEIARKILGFDIIVLFFSNNSGHFWWIQNFPNCLYTDKSDIYEEFITKYNEQDLRILQSKVENYYHIKLKALTFDFIYYPNYKNEGDFSQLEFKSHNLRHVIIKNGNKYLCIAQDGNVFISEQSCLWDITIYDNDMTLICNKFYLDLSEDNENVKGYPYMVYWYFKKVGVYYYFINTKKNNNNILSVEDNVVKVNKISVGNNELFELIDVAEEE